MLPYERFIMLCPQYLSLCFRFTFAFQADAFENNIMSRKQETVCILDRFLQIFFIFHVHIKNTSAL